MDERAKWANSYSHSTIKHRSLKYNIRKFAKKAKNKSKLKN